MIAVIGGGIFGLTIGWYLARSNHPVTVLERDEVGRGATWSAAGMLMPWKLSNSFSPDLFELQQKSHSLWPAFAAELAECSATDIHYQQNGRFFVALDEKATKRFRRQYEFHRQAGLPLEWLNGDEARQKEPQLGSQIMAAMFSPLGGQVDTRQLVVALRKAFLQAGGTLREKTGAEKIRVENQRVTGIRLSNETLSCDTVVIAAGAWSGQLNGVPPAVQKIIQPLKGQTITLQMSPDKPLIRQQVIGPVFLVPRPDGRLLLGTTVEEEAGFDTQSTPRGVTQILNRALEIVPGIGNLPIVEMGAGLRPTAPGRKPILGPSDTNGLIFATGGHTYGILLCPIVSQSIARLIQTGNTPEVIRPFVLRRE